MKRKKVKNSLTKSKQKNKRTYINMASNFSLLNKCRIVVLIALNIGNKNTKNEQFTSKPNRKAERR